MREFEFQKEHVFINDLLKSTIAVGSYRGKEVWEEIKGLIENSEDEILFCIDLRKMVWLNTGFCEPAFGPMFRALLDRRWSRKYLIFQMYAVQKLGFFQGILRYLTIDAPRKESEQKFISENLFTKLIVGDDEKIDFLGNLNSNENKILQIVNDLKKANADRIKEQSFLTTEVVVDTLRALLDKYFILKYEKEGDETIYCSFYNFIGGSSK